MDLLGLHNLINNLDRWWLLASLLPEIISVSYYRDYCEDRMQLHIFKFRYPVYHRIKDLKRHFFL